MILCSHDSDIDSVCLDQGPANFSHKEPGSNILSFRACGHRGDHPALLGGGGGSTIVFLKPLFTKTGGGWDWPRGCGLLTLTCTEVCSGGKMSPSFQHFCV